MEIGGGGFRATKYAPVEFSNFQCLQFYKYPPTETISLQEFEEAAVERLKAVPDVFENPPVDIYIYRLQFLKAVETIGLRHIRVTKEYKAALDKELMKSKFKFYKKDTRAEIQRLDHLSHFILRMAYCRSEELRRWFIQQELDLFRYRFMNLANEEQEEFLHYNELHYKTIKDKEKFIDELKNAGNVSRETVLTTDYYKIPFIEALDLVRQRKVYLENGYAFVSQTDLISIVLLVYRVHLSQALAITSRALPHLEEDNRLLPMLHGLSKCYLGQDYTNRKYMTGQVTSEMVDALSKSFPLCMQKLHQGLRQNHHLRHGGRMQYGLFLKGIGLSLDEAIKFWRAEFTKLMDNDRFDKQYAYNIRHNYGKEGKRADYTPHSCVKIIMSNPPGPGDMHGCPFKHSDVDLLQQRLRSQGISKENTNKIKDMVEKGHYQLACIQHFEALHNISDSGIRLQHPNQYFEEIYQQQQVSSVISPTLKK